eukprot:1156319-Pelagomonas_calceolata.AAC.6
MGQTAGDLGQGVRHLGRWRQGMFHGARWHGPLSAGKLRIGSNHCSVSKVSHRSLPNFDVTLSRLKFQDLRNCRERKPRSDKWKGRWEIFPPFWQKGFKLEELHFQIAPTYLSLPTALNWRMT